MNELLFLFRQRAHELFMHGYRSYMNLAYPADELMPLSCKGRYRGVTPSRGDVDDSLGKCVAFLNISCLQYLFFVLGSFNSLGLYPSYENIFPGEHLSLLIFFSFSLTLVDSLDTLIVVGELNEFESAVKKIVDDVRFDSDIIVSVFETNIRILGGLLSGK